MEFPDEHLQVPNNFDFPFPPYDIQQQFMQKLYFALENRKLGIFESPTGTGKSLSIICGAIKWLKDRQALERTKLSERIAKLEKEKQKLAEESQDWISSQSKEINLTQQLSLLKIEASKISEYEKKIENIRNLKERKGKCRFEQTQAENKKNKKDEIFSDDSPDDEDFLPEEENNEENFSDDDEQAADAYKPVKIYICSRTHSQLAQFLGEIVKSPFGKNVRVTTLASRQTYCTNQNVSSLKMMGLMNERCLDLQKNTNSVSKKDPEGKVIKKQKNKTTTSCPYYRQAAIEELRDQALAQILDIEDLVSMGEKLKACPYYASRKAAEDSEVVLIPYNTLLHKATREANSIQLKDSVVIIDEAHNLLEALSQMYNVELGYSQVYHSLLQLRAYKTRFNNRFAAKTLLLLNQLIFVLAQLRQLLDKNSTSESSSIYTLENFVTTAQIDNYNMFKLVQFCRESRIAQKIRSYTIKYPVNEEILSKPEKRGVKDFLATLKPTKNNSTANEERITEKKIVPPASNPLLAVLSFLESLTTSSDDARILFRKSADKLHSKLQFLLLNPSSNFKDIVKEARSVIVAGGTMKPVSEFRNRLFINAGAAPERILEFSCDHIVLPENILPIIVTKGPKTGSLLFNFENRMNMGNNLKSIILQSCKSVKGGIVVFFPSYNYEQWIWQQMKDLNFGRAVFREPQNSGSVDGVLEKYSESIRKPSSNGALLFSVVGGKLSEGLNFSDDLGRCVIVVGLPYANIMAADLKEKMSYLDKKEGSGSGKKFYENQCMKAVNQCIGRAVRHKNDYATVLLLDERYNRATIKEALPTWIKKSLRVCNSEETFSLVEQFFRNKKTQT